MLPANVITIPSSFKKIIFNDSFLFAGDQDFCKMTPTNATLKITVNKKLNNFQAMQSIKLEEQIKSLKSKIKRRKKKKKAKISVKVCEETAQVGKKKLPENIVN